MLHYSFFTLVSCMLGALVGIVLTFAVDGMLLTWARALRRTAKLFGATRALVAIALRRTPVSKLPEDERKRYRRIEAELCRARRVVLDVADERDMAVASKGELVNDLEVVKKARDEYCAAEDRQYAETVAAHKRVMVAETDAGNAERRERVAKDEAARLTKKVSAIQRAFESPDLGVCETFTVVRRVLDCGESSPDHGLGACGCDVSA